VHRLQLRAGAQTHQPENLRPRLGVCLHAVQGLIQRTIGQGSGPGDDDGSGIGARRHRRF
jgi:hypothetical protein